MDCTLKNTGRWFCYYCQAIKNHKGPDCPQSGSSSGNKKSKDKRYLNLNKNSKSKSKNKSGTTNKNEQKGFKNKEKGKLNQASKNKGTKNKNNSGKVLFTSAVESKEVVNFIADSGASDHIVNKSFILSYFYKCENGVKRVQIKMNLQIL